MDLAECVTLAQAQRQFDTNFFGVLRMNRAVLPAMKRQGSGLLLHVSSGAGRLVIPGMGLYCASKFAMEALAEVYRYELASQGIDSVVIEPGAYATPIMEKLERGEDPGRKTGYGDMARVPEIVRQDWKLAGQPAGNRRCRATNHRNTRWPAVNSLSPGTWRARSREDQRAHGRDSRTDARSIWDHRPGEIQDAHQRVDEIPCRQSEPTSNR